MFCSLTYLKCNPRPEHLKGSLHLSAERGKVVLIEIDYEHLKSRNGLNRRYNYKHLKNRRKKKFSKKSQPILEVSDFEIKFFIFKFFHEKSESYESRSVFESNILNNAN